MNFFITQLNTERQRKELWKVGVIAYSLAFLVHFAIWKLYQLIPSFHSPEEKPQVVEVSLVSAHKQPPSASVSAQPSVAPITSPVPKQEASVAKKLDKPKPKMNIKSEVKKQPEPKPETKILKREPVPTPESRPELKVESSPEPKAKLESKNAEGSEAESAREQSQTHRLGDSSTHASEQSDADSHQGVSSKVVAVSRPPFPYPRIAQNRGWEGKGTLSVQVLNDGTVGEVKVLIGTGHDVLDEAAVETVKEKWRFKPQLKNGRPVESIAHIPFSFVLKMQAANDEGERQKEEPATPPPD